MLKDKYLGDEASESESDYDMDIDDNSRDMVNNVVLNYEDDPEIKFFKLFCKALPLCYPLILNWTKIPYPCSKTMQPWSEEHDFFQTGIQIVNTKYTLPP